MLFDASTTYAPGEPHGDTGKSQYMDMTPLGRYDLASAVDSPNLWLGIAGIAGLLFLGHKFLGGKK